MQEICPSGSMSGKWKRSTVGYSGPDNRKGRSTRMAHLHRRATSRLYQPPAHMGGGQKADTVKVQVTETVRFGT